MLFLTVNGHEPVDTVEAPGPTGKVSPALNVHAGASSCRGLDRLEIIWKGRVVKTVAASKKSFGLRADIEFHPKESGWFAARAFEKPGETRPIPNIKPVLEQG
jgi:hypothetical protein